MNSASVLSVESWYTLLVTLSISRLANMKCCDRGWPISFFISFWGSCGHPIKGPPLPPVSTSTTHMCMHMYMLHVHVHVVCYVCRKVRNSQARTGHQRGMGVRTHTHTCVCEGVSILDTKPRATTTHTSRLASVASMNGGAILASTPHLAPTWTRPHSWGH